MDKGKDTAKQGSRAVKEVLVEGISPVSASPIHWNKIRY